MQEKKREENYIIQPKNLRVQRISFYNYRYIFTMNTMCITNSRCTHSRAFIEDRIIDKLTKYGYKSN